MTLLKRNFSLCTNFPLRGHPFEQRVNKTETKGWEFLPEASSNSS